MTIVEKFRKLGTREYRKAESLGTGCRKDSWTVPGNATLNDTGCPCKTVIASTPLPTDKLYGGVSGPSSPTTATAWVLTSD